MLRVADQQEVHLTFQDFTHSVVCSGSALQDERWGVLKIVQHSTIGTEGHCMTCTSEQHFCALYHAVGLPRDASCYWCCLLTRISSCHDNVDRENSRVAYHSLAEY